MQGSISKEQLERVKIKITEGHGYGHWLFEINPTRDNFSVVDHMFEVWFIKQTKKLEATHMPKDSFMRIIFLHDYVVSKFTAIEVILDLGILICVVLTVRLCCTRDIAMLPLWSKNVNDRLIEVSAKRNIGRSGDGMHIQKERM
jgi:hypothetical protein